MDFMLQKIHLYVCFVLNYSKRILSNQSCHSEHAAYVLACKLLSGDTQIHSLSLNLSSYGELPDIHYRNEQACQQFGTQYMHECCQMFLLLRFSHPHCEFSTTASCHHICKHRELSVSVLFAYRQLVSDSYYQLFHEKSRNCADAYIISIASNVDILHVDYAKQTYPVLPLTEWQYE